MKPLIVGVGQPLRGDDSIGPLIVRGISQEIAGEFDTLLVSGDPLELLDVWQERSLVVIVDAYADEANTNNLRHWQFGKGEGEAPFVTGGFSSHMIGLGETIELGRNLERLPESLHLIGIPGRRFVVGEDPGEEVLSRISEVRELIGKIIEEALGA
ncbi:MAG: hydrogenase maturation protease [Bdellovibrionaceae bacterium]|nr:hydrogenase maturation protease [Bdellovibrionales bacterium]MCB9084014.1 hydrogenase maturation protease [Pseudobdellovibrionaceae bacterium]